MAAVTICSDLGAPQNKVWHCFHCFPIYFPWSDGTRCHDLRFLNVELEANFSLSSSTFIKRLFSSSSLSAIRVVSSAYLRSYQQDHWTSISRFTNLDIYRLLILIDKDLTWLYHISFFLLFSLELYTTIFLFPFTATFFLILFFNFTILYLFCHISIWIHHRYACVPHPEPSSFLPPCTIPLGHPSAPAPSFQYRASNLDWRLISYMILYMFQCHSPKSSHHLPLPLQQSP